MELIRTDYGRAKRTIALELNEDIVKDINAVLSNYVYRSGHNFTVEVSLEEVEDIAKCLTNMPKHMDEDMLDTYRVEICRKSDLIDNAHISFGSCLGDVVKELLDDYLYDSYDYDYEFDGDVSDYWIE